MTHRFLISTLRVLGILLVLMSLAPVLTASQGWTPPRTPGGQPDLQGVWTNATVTPFERPAALVGKAFLTEEEAIEAEAETAANRASDSCLELWTPLCSYNEGWFDFGTEVVGTRRTSLVVDPPDGRVPLKPEAEAKRDYNAARNADSYEYMSVWDRCITRGVPGGMFPASYNNAYQIVQTPGYITILYEMIHEARVIPLDGREHLPSSVRFWNGDSVGHWEGHTLVVDVTNFNDKGWIATRQGRMMGIPQSTALHVVERFTPVDADTINYEVTIEDPPYYTRPWTVSIPLIRDPNYQIFEYACHEGNDAVPNILRGGRVSDRAAAAADEGAN